MTWGDLRSGSGATRCAEDVNGNGTPPLVSHLSWDSFVASAPGTLPTGADRTRLLTDGEGGGQSSSDDWFPWLAVDQTNGQAAAGFYSTRDDPTRRTTNFYARSVGSQAGVLGPLTRVSGAPSDYSTQPCCTFGNDYGDYTGTDATAGLTYLVWSDKRASGGDGEAFTSAVSPAGPQSEPPPPPPPPPPNQNQPGGQAPAPVTPTISPTPSPATIVAPSIAFPARRRTITATRRGSFSYSLTVRPAALAGGISFQTTSAIAVARRRRLNLGFKSFTTPVRGSTTVTVKVSRANFAILRRRRSLRVRATAAVGSIRRSVIFTL